MEKSKRDPSPTYLGGTLERSLTYKQHLPKTAQKIKSRNFLDKLAETARGAKEDTLRTAALTLLRC